MKENEMETGDAVAGDEISWTGRMRAQRIGRYSIRTNEVKTLKYFISNVSQHIKF